MNRLTYSVFFGLILLASCVGTIRMAPLTAKPEPQDVVRTGPPEGDAPRMEPPERATHPGSRQGEPGGHQGKHGASSDRETQQHSETATPSSVDVYTCPMHPKVEARKPGSCALCGMKLVKKTEEHQ